MKGLLLPDCEPSSVPGDLCLGAHLILGIRLQRVGPKFGKIPRTLQHGLLISLVAVLPESLFSFFLAILEHLGTSLSKPRVVGSPPSHPSYQGEHLFLIQSFH